MSNAAIELNTVTYTEDRVKKTYVNLSNNVTLELRTSHDKGRKVMRSTISRSVVTSTEGGGSVRSYRPMEDVQALTRVPVARYSAKLLNEQHDALLYLFEDPEWIEWAEKIEGER